MKHFHGSNKQHSFFEGWYLKHQTDRYTLALIPAFHVTGAGERFATLQVIDQYASHLLRVPEENFYAEKHDFHVQIGANHFSNKGLKVEIENDTCSVQGELEYGSFTKPGNDIMGYFKRIPFMQCRHGILSFSHSVNGSLNINGEPVDFNNGTGYIEKDWGSSFPKTYLWTQCSWTDKDPCCIMATAADIPFLSFNFTGCICAIRFNGTEYRLATYQGVKIIGFSPRELHVSQGEYDLKIQLISGTGQPLKAPVCGAMDRVITESAVSTVRYTFKKGDETIFNFISDQAGFEYAE